jgi:predicted dehydrogenase
VRLAVVGCGLIGRRRAEVATADPRSSVSIVIDSNEAIAQEVAAANKARWSTQWRDVIADDVDVVVVATPNAYLAEIGAAALYAGKHVLVEKPMGRNLVEAQKLARAAQASARFLKVGFNHRYHAGLLRAYERFANGDLGTIINMRVRYGHGGRPGYEKEWRGSPDLAGGGELTDQGVHILDLLRWFAGDPKSVYCVKQTAVWPLGALEDNAFAILRYEHGAVASFHSTWTQWKNLFSFEVYCTKGSLAVEGLGKSYGVERFIETRRKLEGGNPEVIEETFDGPDESWRLEWEQFTNAIEKGASYYGGPENGVAVMRALDALYQSSANDVPIMF